MDDQVNVSYLDPAVALILQETADAKPVDRSSLPVAEARSQMELASSVWNTPLPEMAVAKDFSLEGPGGQIPLRLLRPLETENDGVIVYLHGGGFVLGSLESHHRIMRMLAIESRCTVLGIDYRLAPEHPFPAALDDTVATMRWLRTDAAGLDLDSERIVLAGDSAGANLALAALLELRDGGDDLPLGAALFYGCYWARLGTRSHALFGSGDFRLSTKEMGWFWTQYLGETGRGHALAEPMYADLVGLPPLFLNHGTVDPLADDTTELVQRLDQAGVVHENRAYPGQVHGFLQMTSRVEAAATAMTDAGQAIRDMLR
ncbi:MAG: alpha/beta hydrolase [Geminicoccaceae bacterium]